MARLRINENGDADVCCPLVCRTAIDSDIIRLALLLVESHTALKHLLPQMKFEPFYNDKKKIRFTGWWAISVVFSSHVSKMWMKFVHAVRLGFMCAINLVVNINIIHSYKMLDVHFIIPAIPIKRQ